MNEEKNPRNVSVVEITKDNFTLWDALVDKSPQGTIFHSSDWINKCASLLNKKYLFLGCFENDELIGGCSLFITRSFKYFHFASSWILLSPYGGFLLPFHDSTKVRLREIQNNLIISSIIDKISSYGFLHVNIVNSPEFLDVRPITRLGWRPSIYYTYVFPLTVEVSDYISKNVRRSIRKAEDMKVSCSKTHDIESYWELTLNTYQKQDQNPPFSKNYLKELFDMVVQKQKGEMWFAKTASDEIVSGEIIIWDSKMTAYRLSAASDASLNKTGAPSLLLFTIFQDLKKRGFKKINLMGGNVPHIGHFISSFNPELVPYYGLQQSCNTYKLVRSLLRMK